MSSPLAAASASPRVVRIKLLKPDSSGHMERIFLHYATSPSSIDGAFMTADSFLSLAAALADLPAGPAQAATLFDVRRKSCRFGPLPILT
jgi:hypothetical protein